MNLAMMRKAGGLSAADLRGLSYRHYQRRRRCYLNSRYEQLTLDLAHGFRARLWLKGYLRQCSSTGDRFVNHFTLWFLNFVCLLLFLWFCLTQAECLTWVITVELIAFHALSILSLSAVKHYKILSILFSEMQMWEMSSQFTLFAQTSSNQIKWQLLTFIWICDSASLHCQEVNVQFKMIWWWFFAGE